MGRQMGKIAGKCRESATLSLATLRYRSWTRPRSRTLLVFLRQLTIVTFSWLPHSTFFFHPPPSPTCRFPFSLLSSLMSLFLMLSRNPSPGSCLAYFQGGAIPPEPKDRPAIRKTSTETRQASLSASKVWTNPPRDRSSLPSSLPSHPPHLTQPLPRISLTPPVGHGSVIKGLDECLTKIKVGQIVVSKAFSTQTLYSAVFHPSYSLHACSSHHAG